MADRLVKLSEFERKLIKDILTDHRKGVIRGDVVYGDKDAQSEIIDMCDCIIDDLDNGYSTGTLESWEGKQHG